MNKNIIQPKYLLVKAPEKGNLRDYIIRDKWILVKQWLNELSRVYEGYISNIDDNLSSITVDLTKVRSCWHLFDERTNKYLFWQVAYPISREELVKKINETPKSAFLSVTFIKKDGSERKLVGRRDVKKHLVNPNEPKKPTVDTNKYWIFFEIKEKQYRAVNTGTVKEAVIAGKHYIVWDITEEINNARV